jgi:transcriptional regulator with PAS, ATPase and Fis domain
VLLTGETGVGKEVFARALHDFGPRAARPFVAVNCAAIPDALFEAELFGHARGSFTGAERARPGLIARAQGGTLLLDEIGELPPLRQATLLRALETRCFRPVGSDDEQPFDVRIVAATNRDLEREVQDGRFRQDLLFRIQVLEVAIPALRDRPEDVPLLAKAFLASAGSRAEIAPPAMALLTGHAWPGNVRELEHQMQRLGTLGLARIEPEHLPREIRASSPRVRATVASREDAERAEVARALADNRGNITHAALHLGLTRHGLKKRMLRLGMRAAPGSGKTRGR